MDFQVALMHRRKFPRIGHTIDSKSMQADDFVVNPNFLHKNVVITEKLDGENTVMGNRYIHARSLDSGGAAWRTMVAAIHAKISSHIPETMRICGENMQGKHSIEYELDYPFYVFQVTDKQKVLSWDDTLVICECLELPAVPEIYRGEYHPDLIKLAYSLYQNNSLNDEIEGYVIRNVDEFNESDFDKNIAKWVRPNHVQTDEHWTKNWTPNKIRNKSCY